MSEVSDDERMRLFLEELSALSRKHGFFIEGCGCCGSPALVELKSLESTFFTETASGRKFLGDESEHYVESGWTELTWTHKK